MSYTYLLVDKDAAKKIAVVRLNRPDALNALNTPLMDELITALELLDKDAEVGCIVLTGNEKAFAAGADIKEMAEKTPVEMLQHDNLARWNRIRLITKPLIAAVSGFALGGGCELAMLCDILIASETARFGQPEINIGVIPGAGGTQRLTRAVGKARAMELILTGRHLDAEEAYRLGLVTKIVPTEFYLTEAKKLAADIASKPPVAVRLAKECINKVYDGSLDEGLAFERRSFYLLFATADMREGMSAFVEKRKAVWQGK